jgi:hypothetical protein
MTTIASLNIREGTRKEKVAGTFLKQGKDAAVKLAVKLGLKETTARTWASSWGRPSSRTTVAAKKKTATKKSPVKKTATKKAA